MNKPALLVFDELMKPIERSRKSIEEIENELRKNPSAIILRSLYGYLFAVFETTLNDSLTYILSKIPQKMNAKEFTIPKGLALSVTASGALVEFEVDRLVQRLSYMNLEEYLQRFCSLASVDKFDLSLLNELIERKATRNLLLHNDLIVNRRYEETAGPLRRSADWGRRLRLDTDYVNDTVAYIKMVIAHIEQSFYKQFSKYTKVKVLKELWEYLFDSPILGFDDYWYYTDDSIEVFKINQLKRHINNMSSSERKVLAIWLVHYNRQLVEFFVPEDFSMYGLSGRRKEHILLLTSLILNEPDLFRTP